MKRRIVTLVLAIVLVCAMCATLLVGCNKPNNETEAKKPATTYVALDINPSVELLLDENNVVVSAKGLNEDAKVLLYGEDDIVGLEVGAAAEKIGKLAAECKYVNGDNNTVNVTVGGQSASGNSGLQADISAGLNKGTGLTLNVNVGANFSLEREIEALKKQYPDNAKIQSIDVAKYRVMMEAMELDADLTIEVAVDMNFDELLEKVDDAREAAIDAGIDMLPKAQQIALETAENVYEAVIERLETVQYYKVALADADKVLGIPTLPVEATKNHIGYIVYKNLDITFDAIENKIEQIHEETDKYLEDADVDAIFATLVEKQILTEEKANAEKTKLVGADKKVTLDEMEAYLDIKLKNAKKEVVDAAEDALDATLDKVDEKIEEAMQNIPESIRKDLENLANDIVIEIEKELGVDLDVATKKVVTEIVNGFVNFNAKDLTLEALENLADKIEAKLEGGEYKDIVNGEIAEVKVEKADSFEAKVKASMTAEQLTKVDNAKAALKTDSKVAEAKKAYDAAVTKAIAEADAYLKQAKADRKAA